MEEITVQGMPLHLSGWNTTFRKVEHNKYHCSSYLMFGFIPIQGAYIEQFEGKWHLRRDDSQDYLPGFHFELGTDSRFLYVAE